MSGLGGKLEDKAKSTGSLSDGAQSVSETGQYCLDPQTAYHRYNICQKLGMKNRLQVFNVLQAERAGKKKALAVGI